MHRSTMVSTYGLTETTSLPAGTETTSLPARTETTSLPALTETTSLPALTETTSLPARTETTSLPAGTETTSLPAQRETATSIVQTTLPASTVSPITETTVQYITSTLPRQTDVITYTSVRPAVSLQRLGLLESKLMFRALGDKFHHGNLHTAATDYDNNFYPPRFDGRQYILQHDSTTDFHRARNEYAS